MQDYGAQALKLPVCLSVCLSVCRMSMQDYGAQALKLSGLAGLSGLASLQVRRTRWVLGLGFRQTARCVARRHHERKIRQGAKLRAKPCLPA
jgi:hypothetical protein